MADMSILGYPCKVQLVLEMKQGNLLVDITDLVTLSRSDDYEPRELRIFLPLSLQERAHTAINEVKYKLP